MEGNMFVTLEPDSSIIIGGKKEGAHIEVVLTPEERAFLSYLDGQASVIFNKFATAGFKLALKVNNLAKAQRILVVEDEAEILALLCSAFNGHGYEAVGCSEADQALECLEHNVFDLVCLGIIMPIPSGWPEEECNLGKNTGIVLARKIKKLKPTIPIMACTVIRTASIREEMREAGIVKVVTKPAKVENIISAAKSLLGE